MDTDSTAVKIAALARRLERLAAEVRELKALYADPQRRGTLRTRAWREAYEKAGREARTPPQDLFPEATGCTGLRAPQWAHAGRSECRMCLHAEHSSNNAVAQTGQV